MEKHLRLTRWKRVGREISKLRTMKKLSFLIVALLYVGMNLNAQTVIGNIENGKTKITINELTLKSKWENYLKTQGIEDANISNFAIHKTSEGVYFMTCTDLTERESPNEREPIISQYGITLIPDGNVLKAGESSCTCAGACGSGCSPERWSSSWRCTDCWPTVATCTKTETAKLNSAVF
ncbi:MAG: hypothetical protein PHW35_11635 [Lentimicrobiaceae bacterium]|nr:hypothetical protein [Lentimicrobiaceae bacterium]MDY0025256.1 hypothetical protein [Lentimicrobium sp.]